MSLDNLNALILCVFGDRGRYGCVVADSVSFGMSQTFERLLKKMDLPRVRLHDLRHTHATLMRKEGVPVKVVSERLGHSSVAFTMQVYQHVLPGMQADAAATFGELVFGT